MTESQRRAHAAEPRVLVIEHRRGLASLGLDELKAMPGMELVAVNQCSGNGRGFSEPRVAGGQAANGLMGNARWTGVPLKAVLDRAGVQAGAVQVRFDGLDGPVLDTTPDFAKALDLDHADAGRVEGELRSRGVTVLEVSYDARVRLLLAAAPDEVDRVAEAVAAATGGRSEPVRVGERWVDVAG